MKKVLKIIGVVVVVLIVLLAIVFGISRSMSSRSIGVGGMVMSDYNVSFDGVAERKLAMEPGLGLQLQESRAVNMPLSADMSVTETAALDREIAETEVGRKIIKNGSLELAVKSMDTAVIELKRIAHEVKGDVTDLNVSDGRQGIRYGYLTLEIPSTNFEQVFDQVKAIGDVVINENVSTDDVTDHYVDVEARLRNHREREDRYRQILQSADTIEEILSVQERIDEERFQIEMIESQLQNLDRRIDRSRINISLTTEDVTIGNKLWRPGITIKRAARSLLVGLTGFVDAIITIVLFLPVVIIWAAVAILAVVILVRLGKWIWHLAFTKEWLKTKKKK